MEKIRRPRRVRKPKPPTDTPPHGTTENAGTAGAADAAADFDSVVNSVLTAALEALKSADATHPTALERALHDVVTAAAGTPRLHRHAVNVACEVILKEKKISASDARRYVALAFGDDLPPDTPPPSKKGAAIAQAISYEDDEPAAEDVELADLLDDLHAFIVRHVSLPPDAAVAISLWCVHTYCPDVVPLTPYVIIHSPTKRCGKSTLLETLALLAYRPQPAANATPAVLFRLIAEHHPTLLLDESDRWIAGKNVNVDLVAIINAGNKQGTPALRTVGDNHEPAAFDVYGPKAIAGIGELPDTLVDRGILIAMHRKPRTVKVERITRATAKAAVALRGRIVRRVGDHHDQLAAVDLDTVKLPEALNDRARNCWEPLAAIAGLAGLIWTDLVQGAATRLSAAADESDGIGVRLLGDMRRVFEYARKEKLLSVTICEALAALDDDTAQWARWHRHAREDADRRIQPTDLARLLKPFGVQPRQIKIGSQGGKGYHYADLADALERYVGDPPAETADDDDEDTDNVG